MKTIIDKSECKSLSGNIEGKLVVIDSKFFKPEFSKKSSDVMTENITTRSATRFFGTII